MLKVRTTNVFQVHIGCSCEVSYLLFLIYPRLKLSHAGVLNVVDRPPNKPRAQSPAASARNLILPTSNESIRCHITGSVFPPWRHSIISVLLRSNGFRDPIYSEGNIYSGMTRNQWPHTRVYNAVLYPIVPVNLLIPYASVFSQFNQPFYINGDQGSLLVL